MSASAISGLLLVILQQPTGLDLGDHADQWHQPIKGSYQWCPCSARLTFTTKSDMLLAWPLPTGEREGRPRLTNCGDASTYVRGLICMPGQQITLVCKHKMLILMDKMHA